MSHETLDRRDFIKARSFGGRHGGAPARRIRGRPRRASRVRRRRPADRRARRRRQAGVQQSKDPILKFAVIGINHGHINAQTNAILRARGELVWLYAKEPDLADAFRKQFPRRNSREPKTKCSKTRPSSSC